MMMKTFIFMGGNSQESQILPRYFARPVMVVLMRAGDG